MVLARKAQDAGQTVVRPHSLKMEARAEWTLFKASGLSMIDRSTAVAAAGGAQDEGAGFFPLPFFVGALALEEGEELEPDWRRRLDLGEGGKVGGERAAKGGATVCNYGSA